MNAQEITAEIERRGHLAAKMFNWSSAHLAGFLRGVHEAMAVPDKANISVHSTSYGFDISEDSFSGMETESSGFKLAQIGRYEAFKAVRSWHQPIKTPDDETMTSQTKFWYLSGSCDFEADEIACEYIDDFPLTEFLDERPAADWIKVLTDDHKDRLEEGHEGYVDLVVERHEDPYFIADRGEGRAPGIFDGYHRIGAALAVGEKTCRVIYASRKPEPVRKPIAPRFG